MSILAAAFGAASQAVSDLKSAGDLAEKLRAATNVLKRDMEAEHLIQQQRLGTITKRIGLDRLTRRIRRRVSSAFSAAGGPALNRRLRPGPHPVVSSDGNVASLHDCPQWYATQRFPYGPRPSHNLAFVE